MKYVQARPRSSSHVDSSVIHGCGLRVPGSEIPKLVNALRISSSPNQRAGKNPLSAIRKSAQKQTFGNRPSDRRGGDRISSPPVAKANELCAQISVDPPSAGASKVSPTIAEAFQAIDRCTSGSFKPNCSG